MSRVAAAKAAPVAKAAPMRSFGAMLQRKCACADNKGSSHCEECARDKLQRKALGGSDPERVPAVVERVLRAPGQPLQDRARAFMEQRFAHSFGNVRVHIDAEAARSARAVGAAAYTVGRNVVFDQGRYAPDTPNGRRLLAHELTHVVQQRAMPASAPGSLTIANSDSALERAADSTASAISTGQMPQQPFAGGAAPGALQRDGGFGALREAEALEQERDARAADAKEKKAGPMETKLLTDDEHTAIKALITKTKLPAASELAHPIGSQFLLHDTSSVLSAAKIQEEKDAGRGPLGAGVSAYVPRDTDAVVARPAFYEERRPSTTEHEKALEIFQIPSDAKLDPEKRLKVWAERRDKLFRSVWNAATPAAQTLALDNALGGQGLTATEIAEEKTGNTKKGKDHKTGAVAQLGAGSTEKVMTAAAWAVGEICKQVDKSGAAAVANKTQDKALADDCKALGMYFLQRELRAHYIVPVEIVQVGIKPDEKPPAKKGTADKAAKKTDGDKTAAKKADGDKKAADKKPAEKPRKKNQNTCDPTNPDIAPIPKPPYSENQYTNVAGLYLRASHIAGRFPAITTHFKIDAFIEGHCDPRCFDIKNLYGKISTLIGHPAGCTYGIIPSYGTKSGTNNLWWNDKICGGSPPP